MTICGTVLQTPLALPCSRICQFSLFPNVLLLSLSIRARVPHLTRLGRASSRSPAGFVQYLAADGSFPVPLTGPRNKPRSAAAAAKQRAQLPADLVVPGDDQYAPSAAAAAGAHYVYHEHAAANDQASGNHYEDPSRERNRGSAPLTQGFGGAYEEPVQVEVTALPDDSYTTVPTGRGRLESRCYEVPVVQETSLNAGYAGLGVSGAVPAHASYSLAFPDGGAATEPLYSVAAGTALPSYATPGMSGVSDNDGGACYAATETGMYTEPRRIDFGHGHGDTELVSGVDEEVA